MKKIFLPLLLAFTALPALCQEFLDMSAPDQMLTFGARIGFNTGNETRSPITTQGKALDAWGTGFDIGAVANINITNCIAVQPGFFFESRSHDFSYTGAAHIWGQEKQLYTNYGHTTARTFKIPVMGVLSMNLGADLAGTAEIGPSLSIGLGGRQRGTMIVNDDEYGYSDGYYTDRHHVNLALRMGLGVQYLQHYYLGIHYDAGLTCIYSGGPSGHSKAWTFSLGYNF